METKITITEINLENKENERMGRGRGLRANGYEHY